MSQFSAAFSLAYFKAKIDSLDAMLREALWSGREDELTGQYEQARNFWREIRPLQNEQKDAVGRIVGDSLTASVLSEFISLVNSKTDHSTILRELRRLVTPYDEARGLPPMDYKVKAGSDAIQGDGRPTHHSNPPPPPPMNLNRPSPQSSTTKTPLTDVAITKVGPPRRKKALPTDDATTRLPSEPARRSKADAAQHPVPQPPTRPVSEPATVVRFSDLPASETEDWTPRAYMGERPTTENPAARSKKNKAYVQIPAYAWSPRRGAMELEHEDTDVRPPKRAAEDQDAGPSRKKSKGKGKEKLQPWMKVEGEAAPPHPHEQMTQSCMDCVKRGWWCLVRKGKVEGACMACQASKRKCSNSAMRQKTRAVKTEEREVTLRPTRVIRPPVQMKSAEYIEDSDGPAMDVEQPQAAPQPQPARRTSRQSTAPAPRYMDVSDDEAPAAASVTESGADKGILTVYDTYRVAAAAISHYDTRIQNVETAATQSRERHERIKEAIARSEEREREARLREGEMRRMIEQLSTTVAGLTTTVDGLSGTVQSLTVQCQRLKSTKNLLIKRVRVLEGSHEADLETEEAEPQSEAETGMEMERHQPKPDDQDSGDMSDMSISPAPHSPAQRKSPVVTDKSAEGPAPSTADPAPPTDQPAAPSSPTSSDPTPPAPEPTALATSTDAPTPSPVTPSTAGAAIVEQSTASEAASESVAEAASDTQQEGAAALPSAALANVDLAAGQAAMETSCPTAPAPVKRVRHVQAPNAVASSSRLPPVVTLEAPTPQTSQEENATLAVPKPTSRRGRRSPSPVVLIPSSARYPLRSMTPKPVSSGKSEGNNAGGGSSGSGMHAEAEPQ